MAYVAESILCTIKYVYIYYSSHIYNNVILYGKFVLFNLTKIPNVDINIKLVKNYH